MELDALRSLIDIRDGKLSSRPGALDREGLAATGLGPREIDELLDKLAPKSVPDFELDLSTAVPVQELEERFQSAVPRVDRPPTE
jgi:hypothetical protein